MVGRCRTKAGFKGAVILFPVETKTEKTPEDEETMTICLVLLWVTQQQRAW